MYESGLLDEKVNSEKIEYALEICGIEVNSFKQSHDSEDCVGYRFNLSDSRSIAVCTDTGYVTDSAREALSGTDMVFLESNHEISMVELGPYPYPLKKRILGTQGHLSNFACAEFMKELSQSGTTRFVLSHLSRENNTPEIARQTALAALSELGLNEGTDFRLYVSPPQNISGGIIL